MIFFNSHSCFRCWKRVMWPWRGIFLLWIHVYILWFTVNYGMKRGKWKDNKKEKDIKTEKRWRRRGFIIMILVMIHDDDNDYDQCGSMSGSPHIFWFLWQMKSGCSLGLRWTPRIIILGFVSPFGRYQSPLWNFAKYFKFLPQLYRKHAAELLVVRRHYSTGYNKLSDGSMSLGVHSLQEVTPCYPKNCECYILLWLLYFGNVNSDYVKFIVVGKYTQSVIIKCAWKSNTSIV